MALLDIENLTVTFSKFKAVDSVDMCIEEGDVLGVVGESGSGKSVTMLAVMGLIAYPGLVTADKLMFDGKDLLSMKPAERRAITGRDGRWSSRSR